MSDWNPALYMQYGAERSRPAAELLARIQLEHVSSVVDLGYLSSDAGRGSNGFAKLSLC